MSKCRAFFGPYFPLFGLKTEIYGVNLRIKSEYRKIRTRKTPYFLQDISIHISFTAGLARNGEWSHASQHAPKIILGALLSRTLDIKIARLVLILNCNINKYTKWLSSYLLIMDNEEQSSEYFYDVSTSNMLNNITLDILFSLR